MNITEIYPILKKNVAGDAIILIDEHMVYRHLNRNGYDHGSANHAIGEFGRGAVDTNTVGGYFSIFKRGMRGVYRFCAERHLHRYLAEFDFRYSNREANGYNDLARTDALVRGVVGKRLTWGHAKKKQSLTPEEQASGFAPRSKG